MTIANVVLNDFTRDNRVLKISQSLQTMGHDVTVVALSGEGLSNAETHASGFHVARVRCTANGLPRGFVFGLIKFTELSLRLVWSYRKVDVWHCNDIEAFVLGLFAKVLNPKLELVYDCHEFESERNGKSSLEKKLVGWLERRFIRFAKQVFVVSPSILNAYQERYDSHGLPAIELLRNVPHANQLVMRSDKQLREALGLAPEAFVALYQGAFIYNRGIEQLLTMANDMKDDGIQLVFMGYGKLEPVVREAASRLDWVHLHPAVHYEDVPRYSADADVGLVSVKPTCLSYLYCLPNKLFEYIQAGLPVMVNNLPDCQSLLSDYGIGIAVQPDTEEQWRQELIQLKERMREGTVDFSSGLRRAQSELTWESESQVLKAAYGPR